jgi:NAD(P)-dependent dehydrogenase (short-subunit alcohol dehydrogenase family)
MQGLEQLKGKVGVVTGGASGIGKAVAVDLVRRGMKVIIADVEQSALARTAEELGAIGVLTDVTSFDSVQNLADEAIRRFGNVHLFCSNAGVASAGRIADTGLSDWAWLLNVNVWGTIHGIKAFLPLLKADPEGGRLVITASVAGFHVTPEIGAYTVTKFAVVALAETLALELEAEGSKVAVTVLCPGPVRSKLGSSQRNRPDRHTAGGMVDRNIEETEEGKRLSWLEPEAVSMALIDALERRDFYVFTHPDMAAIVMERHQRIAAALKGRP